MEAKLTWQIISHNQNLPDTSCSSHIQYVRLESESIPYNAELLLNEIDQIIQRVANNQLSAGQGWREMKRIMQSKKIMRFNCDQLQVEP